jgi:hypothetical protein
VQEERARCDAEMRGASPEQIKQISAGIAARLQAVMDAQANSRVDRHAELKASQVGVITLLSYSPLLFNSFRVLPLLTR